MTYIGKLAKGGLYTSDGSNYVQETVGTNDQALISDDSETTGLNYATLAGGGGAYEHISTVNASAVSSVSFTDLTSAYSAYEIWFTGSSPFNNLRLRTSSDNGSTYDSGASDYRYNGSTILQSSSRIYGVTGANGILISRVASLALRIQIFNPSDTVFTTVLVNGYGSASLFTPSYNLTTGQRQSAALVDAIQFTYSDGSNITGTFKLYGISAT